MKLSPKEINRLALLLDGPVLVSDWKESVVAAFSSRNLIRISRDNFIHISATGRQLLRQLPSVKKHD